MLTVATVPLDLLAGFLEQRGVSLPVTEIVRLSLFAATLILCYLTEPSSWAAIAIFLSAVTLMLLLQQWPPVSSGAYLAKLRLLAKFLIFPAGVVAYRNLPNRQVRLMVWVAMGGILANVLLFQFGLGRVAYSRTGQGVRGLIGSANEFSAVFVALSTVATYLLRRTRWIWFVVWTGLVVVVGIAIGMKASVFGGLLVTFVGWVWFRARKPGSLVILRRALVAGLLVSGIGLAIVLVLLDGQTEYISIVARIAYFYARGGIWDVILSGRDIYVANEFPTFVAGGIRTLLLGLPYVETVELDALDILMNWGLPISVIIVAIYVHVYRIVRGRHSETGLARGVSTALLLVLFIGLISGHVVHSALVNQNLALLVGLALSESGGYQETMVDAA